MDKQSAIFINADTCLIPDNGGISDDFFDAFKKLASWVRQGNYRKFPRIVLCSKKSEQYMMILARLIGLPETLLIIENGAVFLHAPTRTTYYHPKLTSKLMRIFRKVVLKRMVPKLLAKFENTSLCPGYTHCVRIKRRPDSQVSSETIFQYARERIRGLIQKGLASVTFSQFSIDIMPGRVNIDRAMKHLESITNIDLERSLAIGLSQRSHSTCGLIGCPANADQGLRDSAKEKKGKVSFYDYAPATVDIIEHFTQ